METNVKNVPGTAVNFKFYFENGTMFMRNHPCFCSGCRNNTVCKYPEYVEKYEKRKFKTAGEYLMLLPHPSF